MHRPAANVSPCRIGLGQLTLLINQVLDGEATMETIAIIEKTARSIVNTADCAIGRDAARLVVEGLEGFRDDYEEHVKHNRCLAGLQNPVPCVALCPAGVDIPGYMALVGEGRCADAHSQGQSLPHGLRLYLRASLRGPLPPEYGGRCHQYPWPEALCRGPRRGGTPAGVRSRHRQEGGHHRRRPQRSQLRLLPGPYGSRGHGVRGAGAAGRYAALRHPQLPLPREKLDAEIESILSLGIEVHTGVTVGRDIWLEKLEQEYDCIYIAIGAHQDKKTGIPGENSKNVISAVEMLRAIGDNEMPDFTGKQVVVIGGGNVAMDVTRSSIRLGADKVTCVYRRRQAEHDGAAGRDHRCAGGGSRADDAGRSRPHRGR